MTGMVVEAESFAPPLSAGVTVKEDEDSDFTSNLHHHIIYDQVLQMRMICLRCSTS
ncbi:unnamed protein product, partial [Musa hybrid cultivar]